MLPIIDSTLKTSASSLDSESLEFGKRLYTKKWVSHTTEIPQLYQHPLIFNATYNAYPVNDTTIPQPTASLPNHYALAFYKFIPSATAPTDLQLTFSQKPDTLAVIAIKKLTDGSFQEFSFNTASSNIVIQGFNTPATDEVVLIIDNISELNGQTARFSTDGTKPATGGGGGGGCFIATAAYGSYLHPKVMVLRNFRDNYLLTNTPGRLFVSLYYKYSPAIADLVRQNDTARLLVRVMLAPLIFLADHFVLALYAFGAGIVICGGLQIKRRRASRVAGACGTP